MSFRPDHELHRRRLGRNLGLGGALLLFVFLVFGLTIEKVRNGAPAEAMLGEPAVPGAAPAAAAPAAVPAADAAKSP